MGAEGKNIQLKIILRIGTFSLCLLFYVSCSCIPVPYGDKIVGFSYIMPCRRQFD